MGVMDNDKIRRQWHFADHQLGLKQMLAGEQNPSLTLEYGPRGKVLETIPESIYTLYDRILKNPQDTKDDALFEEVYAEDFSKRPIKMMYSALSKDSPESRESRKWSEISVMSSPISKWKEKPPFFMKTLSLFFPKCLEPSKILARSMMAKKKMKFHSCLVFLLRNSWER